MYAQVSLPDDRMGDHGCLNFGFNLAPFMCAKIYLMLALALAGCSVPPALRNRAATLTPQDADWIHTEAVSYQENHDPSMIWLQDGRHLMVIYDSLTWKDVDKWENGRKLTLAFSAQRGCVLIDAESRENLPVIAGWGDKHPLDILLQRNLGLTRTTLDIIEAYDASTARWKKEIDRLYLVYLEYDQIPAADKVTIRKERALWDQFLDGHDRVAGCLYSLPDGTMWSIKAAEHDNALIKSQACRLQDLLYPLAMASAASSQAKDDTVEHSKF